MAIGNVQAVAFCNEQIRRSADQLAQCYYRAKMALDQWAVLEQANIPNDDTERVLDNANLDGRPVIHGDDVHNILNRLTEFVADYEATNNAKLNTVLSVSPNPTRGLT